MAACKKMRLSELVKYVWSIAKFLVPHTPGTRQTMPGWQPGLLGKAEKGLCLSLIDLASYQQFHCSIIYILDCARAWISYRSIDQEMSVADATSHAASIT